MQIPPPTHPNRICGGGGGDTMTHVCSEEWITCCHKISKTRLAAVSRPRMPPLGGGGGVSRFISQNAPREQAGSLLAGYTLSTHFWGNTCPELTFYAWGMAKVRREDKHFATFRISNAEMRPIRQITQQIMLSGCRVAMTPY